MFKVIKIKEKKIIYDTRTNLRAKYLRLTVFSDGRLVVTVPKKVKEEQIVRFLKQKANWIIKSISVFQKQNIKLNTYNLSLNDCKNYTLKFIENRINYYNQFYDFCFKKIYIKDHISRWGSCSVRKNLNFNYRLIFLPLCLSDYVIIHELCHLKYLDHSIHFWNLVKKTVPDYKEREKFLKKIYF
jgi:hypothetical protein